MSSTKSSALENLDLKYEIVQDLEDKANSKLGLLNKTSRVIKGEIFKILEEQSTFIQYPIKDEELCAFVFRKKDKVFSFVNSFIPYEKQIFAAAHELYHIWFDAGFFPGGEVLKNDVLEGNNLSDIELRANRFAALFLVSRGVLANELSYMKLNRDNYAKLVSDINENNQIQILSPVVKLMNIFGVPYKTMVRRLYEIEFLDKTTCLKLLEIPDRDQLSGVRLVQRRLQIGEEYQQGTNVIRFEGLVNNALLAYERNQISGSKLSYLLSIAGKKPEEFNINLSDGAIDEEEFFKLLSQE